MMTMTRAFIFARKENRLRWLFLLHFVCFALSLTSQTWTIVSWNIQNLGGTRSNEEIASIASLVRHADIVAVQEVVANDPAGAKAVARLADALNRTGTGWDYSISDPTQSPSSHIRERYAFLWKKSSVQRRGRPYLFTSVDTEVHREPYIGVFSIDGVPVTLINYHSRTHEDEREVEMEEIQAITGRLPSFGKSDVLWLGDFNLQHDHPSFQEALTLGYAPYFKGKKTTLKKKCNQGVYLSSEEDNIFYHLPSFRVVQGRVIDFMAGKPCEQLPVLRSSLSDHLPLEVRITRLK